eukprot:4096576-Pleurochrysis_carterae.AAC.5
MIIVQLLQLLQTVYKCITLNGTCVRRAQRQPDRAVLAPGGAGTRHAAGQRRQTPFGARGAQHEVGHQLAQQSPLFVHVSQRECNSSNCF